MPPSINHFDKREGLLALLTAPGRYPLEVRDDSMVDAGIFSGDTVVVQSQQHARNGDIVVALIDNIALDLKSACQDDLFKRKHPRRERAHCAMDQVNQRYGSMTLSSARLLGRSRLPDVISPA